MTATVTVAPTPTSPAPRPGRTSNNAEGQSGRRRIRAMARAGLAVHFARCIGMGDRAPPWGGRSVFLSSAADWGRRPLVNTPSRGLRDLDVVVALRLCARRKASEGSTAPCRGERRCPPPQPPGASRCIAASCVRLTTRVLCLLRCKGQVMALLPRSREQSVTSENGVTFTAPRMMSSRPRDFHPRALPEPCMTLSSHTAPDVQPLP
jgi:hypothetical protein